MECYMMSRTRAKVLAEALRKQHKRRAKAITPESVRMYCISSSEHERDPLDGQWLEKGPIDAVAASIDIEKLLGMRH